MSYIHEHEHIETPFRDYPTTSAHSLNAVNWLVRTYYRNNAFDLRAEDRKIEFKECLYKALFDYLILIKAIMASGGARPGAGRKKGFSAKTAEEGNKLMAQMVFDSLGPIVEALIKKAKGGDLKAINILFDRVLGKIIAVNPNDEQARENAERAEQLRSLMAKQLKSAKAGAHKEPEDISGDTKEHG